MINRITNRIFACVLIAVYVISISAAAAAHEGGDGMSDNDIYTGITETVKPQVAHAVDYGFDDVTDTSLMKKAGFLVKMGFMDTADGKFRPDENMTRYELAAAMAKITNANPGNAYDVNFYDIKSDDERYPLLAYAFENGWLNLFNDNTIRCDEPASASLSLKAILNVMGYAERLNITKESVFSAAQSIGLLKGTGLSLGLVDRGTMARLIYNALTLPMNRVGADEGT